LRSSRVYLNTMVTLTPAVLHQCFACIALLKTVFG
jgi:hypothetical protein